MLDSSLRLNDPKAVWLDDNGRTPAYFCKRNPVKINAELIAELKSESARLGNRNLRLCLHENSDAPFHEMVILEYKGRFYRPHKHLLKAESYHIIEGKMAAFVFDEDGNVIDSNILEPTGNFLYRIDINQYHAVLPMTDMLIYHEAKPGPFLRETDSIIPPWAPDWENPEAAAEFSGRLMDLLGTS